MSSPSPAHRARLTRARAIRRRVIGAALALFVAVWLLIAVTLASGHDPSLSDKAAAVESSSPSSSLAAPATTTSGAVAQAGGSASSAPAPLTTSQS